MPYDKDYGVWYPDPNDPPINMPHNLGSNQKTGGQLVKVVDVWISKDYPTDTTRIELRFLYNGKKYSNSMSISNDAMYDLWKAGMNGKEVELHFFSILAKQTADSISDNEFVRSMTYNIFMAYMSKTLDVVIANDKYNNQKFDTSKAVSAGTHDAKVTLLDFVATFEKDPAIMSKRLPGMDYITLCPARDDDPRRCLSQYLHGSHATLWNMIQHLNDHHEWTREGQIADWLDKLHDDGMVDLSFKTPDN